MEKRIYEFASESVGPGHPDKVCDIISDALVDAHLEQDPNSRTAIETAVKGNKVWVFGEVTSQARLERVDIERVVRDTIKEIGYDDKKRFGFSFDTCKISVDLYKQSPDIAQGVDSNKDKEQGAGDQGMMFGYATKETQSFMPLPITLAHALVYKLDRLRKTHLPWLRPDCKSQATITYVNGSPINVKRIVLAASHDDGLNIEEIRKVLIKKVIEETLGDFCIPVSDDFRVIVNGSGKFVRCGPAADAGLTGRKIIVDTYGGRARHGGGAFSGKDSSKVDRSAAYVARYIAKHIVASNLVDECEVQLSYALGVAEPTSLRVDCKGKISDRKERMLEELVKARFPIKPADIVRELDLKEPIFKETAAYGHFGDVGYERLPSWEKFTTLKIRNEIRSIISSKTLNT